MDKHRLFLDAWRAALADTPVIYLSGPITTGPRFVRWHQRASTFADLSSAFATQSRRMEVVEPNERDMLSAARELRRRSGRVVIEPASVRVAEWSQRDYLGLWERFIEDHASALVMMPGWEFSAGSAHEFLYAARRGLPVQAFDGHSISLSEALTLLRSAQDEINRTGTPIDVSPALDALAKMAQPVPSGRQASLRKDASLDQLAEWINVAQFVSFSPNHEPQQEYSRVFDFPANHRFEGPRVAIEFLLQRSAERSINIRSYTPDDPYSREFLYGLKSADEAYSALTRLSADGLYTIANETVDIRDGGVSGVVLGDIVEFAPDDTPRAVEKPGVAALPRSLAIALLSTVYRFTPEIDVPTTSRLEFSIHPRRRGWRHRHTIAWEYEPRAATVDAQAQVSWPNNFSRMLGDKAFGLLLAHHLGLPTPRTTVIARRVAPFVFGTDTGSSEVWTRTSPSEQVPGKFTTVPYWVDPFVLLASEDPECTVASVLSQSAISGMFSGAAIVDADFNLLIEGRSGSGLPFMQGLLPPEDLPASIASDVRALYESASRVLGPVRFEWVHDGQRAWVVQLHHGATLTRGYDLVPGPAKDWTKFHSEDGLSALRTLIDTLRPSHGIEIIGDIGVTSHIADVLRRAKIPARIKRPATPAGGLTRKAS